jgi:hypothetical protein
MEITVFCDVTPLSVVIVYVSEELAAETKA